jgi:TRAP-type mannitol/chloroaromatic compound transport system permease small subunit
MPSKNIAENRCHSTPQIHALFNLIGFALCILPISLLVAYYGIDFAYSAYLINEQSGDPGGLTHRFIIKSIIPISFILIIISGILFAKNNYEVLKQ